IPGLLPRAGTGRPPKPAAIRLFAPRPPRKNSAEPVHRTYGHKLKNDVAEECTAGASGRMENPAGLERVRAESRARLLYRLQCDGLDERLAQGPRPLEAGQDGSLNSV